MGRLGLPVAVGEAMMLMEVRICQVVLPRFRGRFRAWDLSNS